MAKEYKNKWDSYIQYYKDLGWQFSVDNFTHPHNGDSFEIPKFKSPRMKNWRIYDAPETFEQFENFSFSDLEASSLASDFIKSQYFQNYVNSTVWNAAKEYFQKNQDYRQPVISCNLESPIFNG